MENKLENQIEKGAAKSHLAHEKHFNDMFAEKERILFYLKNKNCVGYKLNVRTLDILNPFLKKRNTWLTIGDYNAYEAQYFSEKNQQVTASDISDIFLIEAKEQSLIENFKKENVEHLSFDNESFDYVSCREAFHHFPRAYLGLYEMIRVSKKATILIEPIDILAKMPLVLLLKNLCDWVNPQLINKIWKNRFSWETVGNYVFKISEREVEKIAMGIGLPCLAFRGMNVLLSVKQNINEIPTNMKVLKKVNRRIAFLNFLCKLRLIPYNSLISIIFKEMPDENLIAELKQNGYIILPLPPNPYLK